MYRISQVRMAACGALAAGVAALVGLTAVPAQAQTNTSTHLTHCQIGKLGLVVPRPDPQDPVAEFDTQVDLVGTVPDTVEVDTPFTISAAVSFTVTDAATTDALHALGDTISASEMGSNYGVSIRDETGKQVGGDADGLPGEPPTVTLDGDTLSFAGTLSGDRPGLQKPGSVRFGLGTFDTELTFTNAAGDSDSFDLWCDMTVSPKERLIGEVKVVAKGSTPGQPGTKPVTSPSSAHPTGTPTTPATPKSQAKQELANTGAGSVLPLSLGGLALLLLGTGMVVVVRRRRSPAGGPSAG